MDSEEKDDKEVNELIEDEVARLVDTSYLVHNKIKEYLEEHEERFGEKKDAYDIHAFQKKVGTYHERDAYKSSLNKALDDAEDYIQHHYPQYSLDRELSNDKHIIAVNKDDKHVVMGIRGTDFTDLEDLRSDLEILFGRHLQKDPQIIYRNAGLLASLAGALGITYHGMNKVADDEFVRQQRLEQRMEAQAQGEQNIAGMDDMDWDALFAEDDARQLADREPSEASELSARPLSELSSYRTGLSARPLSELSSYAPSESVEGFETALERYRQATNDLINFPIGQYDEEAHPVMAEHEEALLERHELARDAFEDARDLTRIEGGRIETREGAGFLSDYSRSIRDDSSVSSRSHRSDPSVMETISLRSDDPAFYEDDPRTGWDWETREGLGQDPATSAYQRTHDWLAEGLDSRLKQQAISDIKSLLKSYAYKVAGIGSFLLGGEIANYLGFKDFEGVTAEGLKLMGAMPHKNESIINKRFKEAENVFDKARAKYKNWDITPVSHSLGGVVGGHLAREKNVSGVVINPGGFAHDMKEKLKESNYDKKQKYFVSTHPISGTKDPIGAYWENLPGYVHEKPAKIEKGTLKSVLQYITPSLTTLGAFTKFKSIFEKLGETSYNPYSAYQLAKEIISLPSAKLGATAGALLLHDAMGITHSLENWFDDNPNKSKKSYLSQSMSLHEEREDAGYHADEPRTEKQATKDIQQRINFMKANNLARTERTSPLTFYPINNYIPFIYSHYAPQISRSRRKFNRRKKRHGYRRKRRSGTN